MILCAVVTEWSFPSHRLEPLLARIQEDRTAVLCPEIDLIDKNTLQYGGTGSFSVGGFWWSLHFSWRPIPPHEQQRRASAISPIRYTRTHCALSDLYVLIMHLVNFCTNKAFSELTTRNTYSQHTK